MNREEARQVLLLYRPGTADAEDPQVALAMELAKEDPELASWFKQHAQFQMAMRAKLQQIEVPEHLKAALLAQKRTGFPPVFPPVWWSRPAIRLSATAALVLLLLGLIVLFQRPRAAVSTQFADFKEMMVSEVRRNYVMEWKTSDMGALRQSIATRGGQADYRVPRGLEDLKLTGGGVLKWQTKPVSMVCFDRGGGQMLFLFVLKSDAVKDPPPSHTPQLLVVHEWLTASWTQGENAYVLAGKDKGDLANFARKYL